MIYLIDDKKKRQEKDYNWTNELFEKHKKNIRPIYNLSELNTLKDDVLKRGDVILYHESFLDGTTQKEEAKDFRKRMEQKAEKDNFSVAFFSGSKSSRRLDGNVAHLPVSVVYQNLEILIKNENNALKYLLFGNNPEMEENLIDLQEKALEETDEENETDVEGKHLFFKPEENWFKNAISNCTEKDLFDSDVSDEGFSQIISDTLSQEKYDNIFIPLCFGGFLSDFNGLQLATRIRCTKTKNQLSNIYIYRFADYSYLLENEYFNILKTKNVRLIAFSKKAVADAAKKKTTELKAEELPKEIAKLKLDIPKNYFDNHSIANEWGIYQMARNGNIKIEDIKDFDINKLHTLYFKWLITKNNLQTELPKEQQEEQKKYINKLEGVKVVGKIDLPKDYKYLLIDDLANKGWKSVLGKVITKESDSIDVATHYSDAIEKLQTQPYEIIFLDVRLTESDHGQKNIEQFTGFKILNEIKKSFENKNFCTPIILLTATNKIWNIDAFKENGVDSFYIKEHPDYTLSKDFSRQNLKHLQDDFKRLITENKKRKEVWSIILNILKNRKNRIANDNINKRIDDKLKMGYDLLFSRISKFQDEMFIQQNGILSFIVFWSILEEVSKGIYDDKWIKNGYNEGAMQNDEWKLPNGNYLVREFDEDNLKVGIKWDSGKYTKQTHTISKENEIKQWTGKLNLSVQIYGICLLNDYQNSDQLVCEFKKLNNFRNKIDFIHSSVSTIFNEGLAQNDKRKNIYDKCVKMLKFINKLFANNTSK